MQGSLTAEKNLFYKTEKNTNLSKQRKAERDYYHEQFEIHKTDIRNSYDLKSRSIMKQLINYYAEPLTHLINQSQGIFPEELKLAKVPPIFKCEDEQLVQNYRPISILPFFYKVCEKIVSKYMIECMDENELFYKNQFAFRKQQLHQSCNHNINRKSVKSFIYWKKDCGCLFRLRHS